MAIDLKHAHSYKVNRFGNGETLDMFIVEPGYTINSHSHKIKNKKVEEAKDGHSHVIR